MTETLPREVLAEKWATEPTWIQVKQAIEQRSDGVDEVRWGQAHDPAHRWGAGRGGPTHPTNVLHLSRWTHDLCHAHPARAYELGWFSHTDIDPQTVPVWLMRPWPGWWLLRDADDGGPHLAHPLQVEDLERDYADHFTDYKTGEIRIPPPPKWVPAQRTPLGAQPEGIRTHVHQH